jgi:FAD/FMN-containing dehydrogenase
MTTSTLPTPIGFRGVFRTDEEARAVYSEAAGIQRIVPQAVAVPLDADDLSVLIRWATDGRIPLVARGSGSSMPGGAIGDGVIVDLSAWRKMGEIDRVSCTIRVGPGVTRAEVDSAAKAQGLRFPVDPSSGAFCTVGGMCATNAAGSHSMRFGATRTWINAVECVFADGTRAELRRGAVDSTEVAVLAQIRRDLAPVDDAGRRALRHTGVIKDSSGYGIAAFLDSGDLVDLIVGSEGTLAFVTAVELRLLPVAVATSSVLAAFASLEDAILAAGKARAGGAAACELLDRTFLEVATMGAGQFRFPPGTEAALLAEVESDNPDSAAAAGHEIEGLFRACGATVTRLALDEHTETELWELRHAASPILARLDPHLRSLQFVEDGAMPPTHLPAYVRGVREIFRRHDTRVVIFGHAGDAHVHVNALIDFRWSDWRERIDRILAEVVSLTERLDGTLAGEHGDGRIRAPLLRHVWSAEALKWFRVVKSAFDPSGILNPGVKIALSDSQSLGTIKYDPALPPLPPRAAAALRRVEQERAYSRSRLDVLAEISA